MLKDSWTREAHNDYGAHYCFVSLLGMIKDWPKEAEPWIIEVLTSSIFNIRPQFQKSRAASALALAKQNPRMLCELMAEILSSHDSLPWDMRYALIQAIDNYSELDTASKNKMILEISEHDKDLFVQARARRALAI
jgi:bilin biosynthesis protein